MNTYPLRITRRRIETPDTVSLWLEVPADLEPAFGYRAGQFITVVAERGGESVARQYSLSSVSEFDDDLRITVKRVPGGAMSSWLVDQVHEGQLLDVAPPRGRFFVPPEEEQHVLLLAAGSGIAPLYSIARQLLSARQGHRVTLVCANRTEESIILRDDLDRLRDAHSGEGLAVEHVLSRPDASWTGVRGRVDPAFLASRWPSWREATPSSLAVYVCGPDGFMAAAEQFFLSEGVAGHRIRRESFDLVLHDDAGDPDLVVHAAGSGDAPVAEEPCELVTATVGGETTEVVPEKGEVVLAALIRRGADIPYSCQEGTCASCIAKVTEGTVRMRPIALRTLHASDIEDGLVLACQARPVTKRVHINFDDL